jgi:hypothetical protein
LETKLIGNSGPEEQFEHGGSDWDVGIAAEKIEGRNVPGINTEMP